QLPPAAAAFVSSRGQRLGDFGSGRMPDCGRQYRAAGGRIPGAEDRRVRWHGLPRVVGRHEGSFRVREARTLACAGTRYLYAAVLAFAFRRRTVVQDSDRARGGSGSGSAGAVLAFPDFGGNSRFAGGRVLDAPGRFGSAAGYRAGVEGGSAS